MNMKAKKNIKADMYPEIRPGKKPLKRMYLAIALFLFGRAFQAAAETDKEVKKEFSTLPDDFLFDLCVAPNGPHMLVGKNKKGKVKYMGWNPDDKKVTLSMKIKNIESAMLLLTFRESTFDANAHDRIILNGEVSEALSIVRSMNLIEVFLLPRIIASMGIKRYPTWSQVSPLRKHINRIIIYIRLITG